MEKWVTAKQGARMLGIDKRNFSRWAHRCKIHRKIGKSDMWVYDLFSLHGASGPVMAAIDRLRRVEEADLIKEQSENLDSKWKGKAPETTEVTDTYPDVCFKNPPNIVSDSEGLGVLLGHGEDYDKELLDRILKERADDMKERVGMFIAARERANLQGEKHITLISKSEEVMENEEGYFVKPNAGDFVKTGTIKADKIKTGTMDFDKLTLAAYERAGIRQRATGTGHKKKQNSVLSFLDRVLMRVVKAEQKIQPDINRIGTMLIGLYLPLLLLMLLLLGGL